MHRSLKSNPHPWRLTAIVFVGVSLLSLNAVFSADDTGQCGVVDIDRVGWMTVETIKRTAGARWWIELDNRLLVCGTTDAIKQIASDHVVVAPQNSMELDHLMLSRGLPLENLESRGLRVIASSNGYAIADSPYTIADPKPTVNRGRGDRSSLTPLSRNTVVLRQLANAPPRPKTVAVPEVQTLVDQVNGNRWFDDVVSLASYNRYTHSPDNINARDWLVSQFQALPGLTVTTQAFAVSTTTAYNVVARLEGAAGADEWVVVGGHYDSTSENPSVAAPGAEDNASGCAGVLEMARIFTTTQPQATILFICYSGEEQGLHGSQAHVSALSSAGDLNKVQAMLDMDMIGYTSDADLDCLLETDVFAQSVLDPFIDAAGTYTQLRIVTTLSAWGSDHVPYLDAGIPALLTIENDWSQYPDYHNTTDVPANLTIAMAEEILKMNVGAMATLTDTVPSHVFADDFESGGTTAWSAIQP